MSEPTPNIPRWLNVWAVVTVLATLPLLLLGAEVTTRDVGMADQVPLRTPWHILTINLQEYGLGFLIEHSHRTAGWIVGLCIIVLAASLWFKAPRPWLRWLGVAALAMVVLQGALGGFRVQLNALFGRQLALVHGCFAQLVFALLAGIALVTTRGWWAFPAEPVGAEGKRLRTWTVVVAALLYLQIVLGSVVRHTDALFGPRAHLLTAFLAVAAVVWLGKLVAESPARDRRLTVLVAALGVLLAAQLFLGVEAWLAKFFDPRTSLASQIRPLVSDPSLFRSLHYLVGALMFTDAVLVALWAHRRPVEVSEPAVAAVQHLEGAL